MRVLAVETNRAGSRSGEILAQDQEFKLAGNKVSYSPHGDRRRESANDLRVQGRRRDQSRLGHCGRSTVTDASDFVVEHVAMALDKRPWSTSPRTNSLRPHPHHDRGDDGA